MASNTLSLSWGDGTQDKLYMTIESNTITFNADQNSTGVTRSKTLTVSTEDNKISASLKVSQSGGGPLLTITGEEYGDKNLDPFYVL